MKFNELCASFDEYVNLQPEFFDNDVANDMLKMMIHHIIDYPEDEMVLAAFNSAYYIYCNSICRRYDKIIISALNELPLE